MMAKMFYTLEETKTALQKNEEEIKQLAREGRLREFRDGPRLMFKADQVEQLKAELGGGSTGSLDQVDLAGPGDSVLAATLGLASSQQEHTIANRWPPEFLARLRYALSAGVLDAEAVTRHLDSDVEAVRTVVGAGA